MPADKIEVNVKEYEQMLFLLLQSRDFIDDYADVVGGGYGLESSNRAMALASELNELLERIGST